MRTAQIGPDLRLRWLKICDPQDSARAAKIKNFLQVNRAGTGAIRSEDFRRYPGFRSVLFQSVCNVSFPP